MKNGTKISEHKVPVLSHIFGYNFLTTYLSNTKLHHSFQYNILHNMTFKYGIHTKYFNFHLNTLHARHTSASNKNVMAERELLKT